jgi:hypothetical protein
LRRNFLGLKPLAVTFCVLALAVVCGAALLQVKADSNRLLAAGAGIALMLPLWVFLLTPNWVKVPADA